MKWIKKVADTPLDNIAKVIDSIMEQTNDRTNAPSIHAVREAIKDNSLTIYPIGSIYMSVNNVDPATIFGGTWEQIKDKFLLASGDTYAQGATGGEASISYTPNGAVGDHVLTEEEIAKHNHEVYGLARAEMVGTSVPKILTEVVPASLFNQCGEGGVEIPIFHEVDSLDVEATAARQSDGDGAHNHSFTGTAATLNNMPPYLAVNVWVRRA